MMKDPIYPTESTTENTERDKLSHPPGQVRQDDYQRSREHAASGQGRLDRELRMRRRAHELWEQEGRPEGRAQSHWERAAQDLDREDVDILSEGAAGEKPGVRPQGDADFVREKS
jgi:hypothetical protein